LSENRKLALELGIPTKEVKRQKNSTKVPPLINTPIPIKFNKIITSISSNKEFKFYMEKEVFQYIIDNLIQLFIYDKTHIPINPFQISDGYFTKTVKNMRESIIEVLNKDSEYEQVLPYSLRLLQNGYWKAYQGKSWKRMEYRNQGKKVMLINELNESIDNTKTVLDLSEIKPKTKTITKKEKIEYLLTNLFSENISITEKVKKFTDDLGFNYSEFYHYKKKYEKRIRQITKKPPKTIKKSRKSNKKLTVKEFEHIYTIEVNKVKVKRKYHLFDIYTDKKEIEKQWKIFKNDIHINYKTETSKIATRTFKFLYIFRS